MAAAAHVASEGVHRGASIHNQLVAYQVSPPCRNDLWTNSRSRGSQPSLVAFQPAASRCRNQNEATCCRHTAARTQLEHAQHAQHRAVASEGLQPHFLCQRHAEVLPAHTRPLAQHRGLPPDRGWHRGTIIEGERAPAAAAVAGARGEQQQRAAPAQASGQLEARRLRGQRTARRARAHVRDCLTASRDGSDVFFTKGYY